MTPDTDNQANAQASFQEKFATPDNTPQLQAFREVVESRRSVRRFTDTKIPDDVLADCLRLAMLAPNSSNLQPGNFM